MLFTTDRAVLEAAAKPIVAILETVTSTPAGLFNGQYRSYCDVFAVVFRTRRRSSRCSFYLFYLGLLVALAAMTVSWKVKEAFKGELMLLSSEHLLSCTK